MPTPNRTPDVDIFAPDAPARQLSARSVSAPAHAQVAVVTWTNPETGAPLTVFVHELLEKHGKALALVNKGAARSYATFCVRLADTDMVLA